ncbi:hypothetical protein RNAN_0552 [Rheinheimera nanhaiensis E407-8]|uniref:Uncharacterized protein n=1 Tax=Rheinheimera nanhaiensis E407-8 TaxID=562729 RepID=I1DU55_9GAMM|nr:hypothetical protein RNAN_0552 [Rheinheimera nanhaiensis E407-8]
MVPGRTIKHNSTAMQLPNQRYGRRVWQKKLTYYFSLLAG